MLTFIPTPIGNLEDITKRSLRLLETSTHIFCEDTRITKKLLHLLEERYSLTLCQKTFTSMHSHNEDEILANIEPEIFKQNCVYMSDAGMPGISDPGAKLVKYCQENEIDYEVLPGANALLLAYVSSGFCENEFSFFGFLPHKGKERENKLQSALSHEFNVILYESPHRIEKLIQELLKIAPKREIFAIKEATKKHEKRFVGNVENVAKQMSESNLKGEWVIVIKSENKDSSGSLHVEDIMHLDIPPKQKAKLLSKLTGESIKDWYSKLAL